MLANTNKFPANLRLAQRRLQAWYKDYGRHHLPWRNTHDPYHVYISEVMLQQTQVKTVLEHYYHPFLRRFPTLAALAAAPREAVMKAWEGLGYYARAANLHAAAQAAAPVLPSSVDALKALPGIGRNTAHAVASFGFGAIVPVMEANVKRVLCRIFALSAPAGDVLWERAFLLLNEKHAFAHNQAMMDIGAMVCTKRNPRCGECPLELICQGKTAPESYPQAAARKIVPVRKRVIVAFGDDQGRYLLRRRSSRFLGGFYGFMEYDENTKKARWEGLFYKLAKQTLMGNIMQAYSHFTLEALVHRIVLTPPLVLGPDIVAVRLNEMSALPLSAADQKIRQLLLNYARPC